MMIQQSEATAGRRTVYFTAVKTADDTAYTGALSGADIMIGKAGGGEANSTGTATHVATGLFKYVMAVAECDTLGEVSIRLAHADVYNDVRVVNVVAFDPYDVVGMGMTNLDATVSSRLPTTTYQDVDDWLDAASSVETGLTLRQTFRALAGFAIGKLSGANTGTETVKAAVEGTTTRFTVTVDSNGNKTAINTNL